MISMPGAGGSRCWLANSTRPCDTAGMSTLSRELRRRSPMRVSAAVLGVAWAALLVAAPQYRSVENVASATWRQLGAIGAAGLLALLAYSAFRGDFASATFYGGAFGVAALGRLMFAHDALAVEAVALLGLVAL